MRSPIATSIKNEESASLEEHEIQVLVSALRDGDRAAATRLYSVNVRAVYRAVRAQCGGDLEAEDIVQETFLKAFRSIDSYHRREGIRFLAWLLKIASTTAHKSRRSRRRLNVMPPESVRTLQENAPGAQLNAESDDLEEQRQTLGLVLERLEERERAVLSLRYSADLTAAEVGHALSLSEPNVRKICERARTKVLEYFKERAPQSDEGLRAQLQPR